MSNAAKFVNYSDFVQDSQKPAMRPALWKSGDIMKQLYGSGSSLSEGRSAVALVNEDTGDANGVSPNMNAVVQVLKPGEHNKPHRHSNMALFIVFQGQGYSIVEGETYEWEKGDVFFAPAWLAHEHCNTSDEEDAILYTIQDVPMLSDMGAWFLEEPVGSSPKRVVSGIDKSDVIPEK